MMQIARFGRQLDSQRRPRSRLISGQLQQIIGLSLRSYYFLNERRVPIVFGPGRHPTSGARFLYFKGPEGMIFEYSVGVDEVEDEATHRPRQFGFEPTSFCMWGSKPAGMTLPNK